jgi:hypothetical protein
MICLLMKDMIFHIYVSLQKLYLIYIYIHVQIKCDIYLSVDFKFLGIWTNFQILIREVILVHTNMSTMLEAMHLHHYCNHEKIQNRFNDWILLKSVFSGVAVNDCFSVFPILMHKFWDYNLVLVP